MSDQPRGKLKIFLGYAAGVGKTYQMLQAAQDLRKKGADVVVGYFEPHGRADTIAQSEGLEAIPRRVYEYRGTSFQEMDTDAVLARKPQVCVVDELAHTNVPGSERVKRWQDVRLLLDAGIDVLSSLNIQHLESLNDSVWEITGIRVRETIPDWVVDEADELVFVDVTPRALRHRLERGVIYGPEKAAKALENFFTEQNLNALRELAMRHAAFEIEGKRPEAPANGAADAQSRAECILVCLDERPSSAMLIRRAKRVADYFRGRCLAVYVSRDADLSGLPPCDREAVEKHLGFARDLHIEAQILTAQDPARAIVDFAHEKHVTQIYMGRPAGRHRIWPPGGDKLHRVVRLAKDMLITIVAERNRR